MDTNINTLKIGIVDDDMLTAEALVTSLLEMGYNPLLPAHTFSSAKQLVNEKKPDFLILDINLNDTFDGIHLAEWLNKEHKIPFVFLSGNTDEGSLNRAKDTYPAGYLVKPYTAATLHSTIEMGIHAFENKKERHHPERNDSAIPEFLFVKKGQVFHKIPLKEIKYVFSENVYLNIETTLGSFVVRSKLDDFLSKYGSSGIIRIHRSYAVNVAFLSGFSHTEVMLNKQSLPLQKPYKDALQSYFDTLS